MQNNIKWLSHINTSEKNLFGNKIISLSKMIHFFCNKEIIIPDGFAINKNIFLSFLKDNNIENKINKILDIIEQNINLPIKKIKILIKKIETLILTSNFSQTIKEQIKKKYLEIKVKHKKISFAVRSSASDEDSCHASFAGQQQSYLNIKQYKCIIYSIKKVYASLYSHESLSYRIKNNISLKKASMSVIIQQMIISDKTKSGVIFTSEPESNNPNILAINSNYGLGESIVQGTCNPDEFFIYKKTLSIIQKNIGSKNSKVICKKGKETKTVITKHIERKTFSLNEEEIIFLSKVAIKIEKYFGHPVDIEWAQETVNKIFYILQARPITSKNYSVQKNYLTTYSITEKGTVLLTGKAIGKKAVIGKVCILNSIKDIQKIKKGDILVAHITDPKWEPAMQIASGIITNLGGRTCHAAIIAREIGIPAIVGCNNATSILKEINEVTMSCCQGSTGYIYKEKLKIEEKTHEPIQISKSSPKVMLNIGNPNLAFDISQLPNHGVGLARMEFIINNTIGIHPNAVIHYSNLSKKIQNTIIKKIVGYKSPEDFFISKLTEGIATIAAAFYPKQVILRLSDFKTNEYRNLIGGSIFEPLEENPMLGFRGSIRYTAEEYIESFLLELSAIKNVIYKMKLDNVSLLVPFVRTIEDAKQIINLLEKNNISKKNGIKIYMMCEIPSNALLAEEFLSYFDGFSIGSNDMTQLVLGIDRDGRKEVNSYFDERNEAVKKIIAMVIFACKKNNKYIGICGQAPSDYPDFAAWLISKNIDSISLNPDSIIPFHKNIQSAAYSIKDYSENIEINAILESNTHTSHY